jgi:transmembrane sensor
VIPNDQEIRFAITQRAAEWFMAHRAGLLDESQRAAFLAWLKASPVHIEEYLGITAMERALSSAADNPEVLLEDLLEQTRAEREVTALGSPFTTSDPLPRPQADRRWFRMATAMGLGVAIACWLGWWGMSVSVGVDTSKSYSTAHGIQRTWQLEDGSVLHLNTDSAVTVRYSARERYLDLDRGQALFEVAKDAHRPFRVAAGKIEVVAIGTEFDVYRQGNTTAITVIDGVVSVAARQSSLKDSGKPELRSLRVARGQQALVEADVVPLGPSLANIRETEAWMQRQIVFDRRALGQVAAEFNRYTNTPFVIEDAALQQLAVSGVFAADDPASFADFLASLEGVRVVRLPDQIRASSTRGAHGR